MKNEITAWYLDEDILLEGKVINNRFYPNTNMCGFRIQEFDKSMIDKEIFSSWKKHFPFAEIFRLLRIMVIIPSNYKGILCKATHNLS